MTHFQIEILKTSFFQLTHQKELFLKTLLHELDHADLINQNKEDQFFTALQHFHFFHLIINHFDERNFLKLRYKKLKTFNTIPFTPELKYIKSKKAFIRSLQQIFRNDFNDELKILWSQLFDFYLAFEHESQLELN